MRRDLVEPRARQVVLAREHQEVGGEPGVVALPLGGELDLRRLARRARRLDPLAGGLERRRGVEHLGADRLAQAASGRPRPAARRCAAIAAPARAARLPSGSAEDQRRRARRRSRRRRAARTSRRARRRARAGPRSAAPGSGGGRVRVAGEPEAVVARRPRRAPARRVCGEARSRRGGARSPPRGLELGPRGERPLAAPRATSTGTSSTVALVGRDELVAARARRRRRRGSAA